MGDDLPVAVDAFGIRRALEPTACQRCQTVISRGEKVFISRVGDSRYTLCVDCEARAYARPRWP